MSGSWIDLLRQYPAPGTVFFGVLLLSTTLTAIFYKLARSRQLLPKIRDRDVHQVRKPRLGGLAIWLAVMVSFLIIAGTPASASWLDFHRTLIAGIDISLWGIMLGMLVILITGLLDDLYGLGPAAQAGGQFLAAFMLVIAGIGIPYIRLPYEHLLTFSTFWSGAFTVVWVMTMMNVMNFFDGLDGLAGSVSLTAALVLVLVSMRTGFIATATLSLLVAGAAGGFLPWNWYPSKIFMGTVGSQTLGFLLGVIAIISGGKVATAMLVLGIPFLDAVIVVIRRLLAHESPFKADLRHLHHRLLKIGIPTPWVVLLINSVSITFGILAFRAQAVDQKALLSLVLLALMIGFIIITYLLEHRSVKRVH